MCVFERERERERERVAYDQRQEVYPEYVSSGLAVLCFVEFLYSYLHILDLNKLG